jgi:hypothetical protein
MTRPLRLEFAGALSHITSRGNRQESICESDDDRALYLSVLDQPSASRYGGFGKGLEMGQLSSDNRPD